MSSGCSFARSSLRHQFSAFSSTQLCRNRVKRVAVQHIARCRPPVCNLDEAAEARELVERFWKLTENGEFSQTTALFTKNAVLHDTLYPRPFFGSSAIKQHMKNMEIAFPVGKLRFILDDISASADLKAFVRWRVITKRRSFEVSKGVSVYTLSRDNSDGRLRISEAFDVPEPKLKVAPVVLPLLRAISTFL